MILAALLLPVALIVIVVAIQRFGLPTYLALLGTVVGYGLLANMTFQAIGTAFGLGFAGAIAQSGLLVIAGAVVATVVLRRPLPGPLAVGLGAVTGVAGLEAGALGLLRPASDGLARRTAMVALTLLAAHGLVVPSPTAVAAASVLKTDLRTMVWAGVPTAIFASIVGWLFIGRVTGRDTDRGTLSFAWIAILVPVAMLVVLSIAQMPSEPLGKGNYREFYNGLGSPTVVTATAIALAVVMALLISRRWPGAALNDTGWVTLILTVGAAGGFARLLDAAGMAELIAEDALSPRLGLMAPFLAAAIVKTLSGNSLSAVLTATGMVEPMLPALGLDSTTGRALAAASAGIGSLAICHVNDPFFWIAAHVGKLTPGRALILISLGSLVVSLAGLLALVVIQRVI